jgi:hypothetical protein
MDYKGLVPDILARFPPKSGLGPINWAAFPPGLAALLFLRPRI